MKLSDSRDLLDEALADETIVLLVLVGDGMIALHDASESATKNEPWRRTFWVTDPGLLIPEELESWGVESGDYVVLRGLPKSPVSAGPVSQLMIGAEPSPIKIKNAFSKS